MHIFSFLALPLIVGISVAIVALQIHLSKRKSSYPGLVLPIVMLLLIILPVIIMYTININIQETTNNVSNAEVSEGIWPIEGNRVTIGYSNTSSVKLPMLFPLYCFFLDIALFVTYFIVRRKITPDKKTELKRMALQDL